MKHRQHLGLSSAILVAAAALSGCSGSERSADYFAAHESDAKQVVSDCTAGRVRGAECENAISGLRKANGARGSKPSNFPVTGGKQY